MFRGVCPSIIPELFNILREGVGYSRHPGLTDSILGEISGIAAGVRLAAERWTDRIDSLAKLPRF